MVTSRSSPRYGSARSSRSSGRKKSSQWVRTTRRAPTARRSRPSSCGCTPRSGRRAGRCRGRRRRRCARPAPRRRSRRCPAAARCAAGVLDEDRPGLAALVRRGLDRRHDRLGDRAREPVRRAVVRLDQREREPAVRHRLAGRGDPDPVGRQPVPAADVRRRLAADEHRAGLVRDDGGVHRVVEVGVHGAPREPVDAGAGQHGVDPRGSGATLPSPTFASDGREKNPSVITAVSPSSSSRLATPRNVTRRRPPAAVRRTGRRTGRCRGGRA